AKLLEAIDWAIAQNTDKTSDYFNRIDTGNIAVAGMSCGGLQALEVAGDPRITSLVVWNSGIFNNPIRGSASPMIPQPAKIQLQKTHSPKPYRRGGRSDLAYNNGTNDVAQSNHVPVFVGNIDAGRGGTYARPFGGDYAKVATGWFDWQLNGD